MSNSKIKLGFVGGGNDSLIGVLHKVAAVMFDRYQIVGGVFSSNQDINTLILGVQIPFASEDFNVESSNITFEKVRDQNGLTFFQSISNNYLKNKSSDIYLSYYNPHGNTSIEYAANISTQDTDVEVPKVASDRFVRYPFLTWEPMIIFILLTIFMVLFYEINLRKND